MELTAVHELPRKDILTEWWSEVKENFWEQDVRPQMQRLLKELMQRTLIEEIEHLRRRDVPADAPILARNGYYRRSLITHVGTIHDLRVPRLRTGGFQTKVFCRYRRCERLVEDLIREVFLAGVSTQRVGGRRLRLAGHAGLVLHRLPDHPQPRSAGTRVPYPAAAR